MPVERIGELMEAFGLPLPAAEEPAFTPDEAQVLEQLWQLRDVWRFELSVQLGRIYGRMLARIAHASVQLWVSVVEPRLKATDLDDRLRVVAAAETFDGLLPVADTLLTGIHRRWIERETSQIAIRGAEREAGDKALPGAVEVSILFCDLKDFTAFADRHGDGVAVRIIDQFAGVVTREHGPEARLTKWLGDGFMLVYPGPGPAVAAGVRIIDGMRAPDRPGVHASVHHGHAIPRESDYFGSVINLTAGLGIAELDRPCDRGLRNPERAQHPGELLDALLFAGFHLQRIIAHSTCDSPPPPPPSCTRPPHERFPAKTTSSRASSDNEGLSVLVALAALSVDTLSSLIAPAEAPTIRGGTMPRSYSARNIANVNGAKTGTP